ncbi:YSIRK-type signal peptide-containing protein, partial [Lactobacillus crispatus]|uniref:YSIRK-type signal peptide-containing protein n=1 Tax=Lactobacillus crispatus TaxID=47770 RepID=UPI001CB805FE
MKRLKFLETKRTPRYSMRKLNVGMASVLLGVTIFGINFTNHSVKAATMESVKTSNSSPNSNSQQTLAAVLTTAERTNTQKATSATEKVQQGSASKNATANNSTEAATTPQSSPETQGSADTDINSSAAKLAATVDQNNINTQKATSATEKVRQGSASKNATANNSTEAATTSQSAPKTQSSADTDIRSLDIRSLTAISAAKLSTMNLMQTNGINGTDTDGNAAAKLSTMNLLAMNLMKASGTDTDTGNVADLQDSLRTTAEEKGVATNHQDTPQGQGTPQNPTNEKGITPNVWAARLLAALVVNPTDPTTSNNEKPSTSLPMSNQDIKLDSQPMLTEITNKPTDNWVYNNLKHYWEASTATVKGILQTHTTTDESGRYYFAGVANYNESYHVIYLLARSNNLDDNKLYVTILHTGRYQNIQEEVVAPGESKKVEYSNGTGGTTHAPIFTNYDGTSVSIDLDGVEKGDNIYGMVVGFAYGQDTGISGDPASMGNGFMTTPMPTKTTTTIHYIDQATGDEIAVPKSFEGVAYQKYTITGEAPTIDGYTLKKSPETTGYISPYKVGGSYDFRLDKHVVIKQTVIDSQGLIRITAYYDGEAINNTTRYLGNMKNVNDHFAFFAPNGKSYTYTNQITSTNDGIVYYYAKDGSEDKSEVRIHYIDVTGNKNSLFVPGDGKEVATDKISGTLGEKYNYNVKLPTDYNLATNQANTVNGTYTIDHHDEYVYVVKKTSAEKITPKVPKTKEPVADISNLTEPEKEQVKKNVEEANKGNFPDNTVVTVGKDGTATITYPDQTDQTKSTDTIPGSDLVRPETDAEKITPKVP